jgi:hypothetical protein
MSDTGTGTVLVTVLTLRDTGKFVVKKIVEK